MRRIWTNYVRTVFIFAVLFLLSACKAELWDASQGPQEVALCASTAQTRTEMLSNGLSATWKSDDEIAVWAKNSSGSFVFSNQTFGVYGSGDGHGYFTSTLQSSMADGKYTYLCCYPKPESVNGTKVTFTLPAEQDGKVSGGADIMIADPVEHGPLATVSEIEDGTGLSMKMNRMMHQFRFYIPKEVTALGDDHIRKFQLTFPRNVVGKVTYDLTNPSAAPVITDGSNVVTVTLDKGLVSTDENGRQYACVAIIPTKFEADESVEVKAYTSEKIAKIDPINLKARNFMAGHSTPVKLNVKGLVDAGIFHFTVKANNLGEAPNCITLEAPTGFKWGDNGTDILVYNPKEKIKVGETFEVVYETDLNAYTAFSGKNVTVTYESEHAVVAETVTVPSINGAGKSEISITVPYLFFEDFSLLNGYDINGGNVSKKKQGGVKINDTFFYSGWTGEQTSGKAGTAIRIRTRNETTWAFYNGRVDSAPISGLKDGASVKVLVSFDYNAVAEESGDECMSFSYGYTTTQGPIDAYWQYFAIFNKDSGGAHIENATTLKLPSSSNMSSYDANVYPSNYYSVTDFEITSCTNKHRLSWEPLASGTNNHLANSKNHWLYLDNIKVQITK